MKSGYLQPGAKKYESKIRRRGGRSVRVNNKAVKLSRKMDNLRMMATGCLEGGKGKCCDKKCLQKFSPYDMLQAMSTFQMKTLSERRTFIAATA